MDYVHKMSTLPPFEKIVSFGSVLHAWQEFLHGKKQKADVAEFASDFISNLSKLQRDLASGSYGHGGYYHFRISDPKPRDIHKASVCDRIVHHLIYRALYPHFDRYFIHDSYSCRVGKGTHRALRRFKVFSDSVSKGNTRTCWVLKCDIRKFFASIDHNALFSILERHQLDECLAQIIVEIVRSFSAAKPGVGLPLGNLTSQILVNIYMNEFDQFVKRKLGARYFLRYADDFVIFSENKAELEKILPQMQAFLKDTLQLEIHPDKVFLQTVASGVDFLGWVHFPTHRVLRTKTKQRMFKAIKHDSEPAVLSSYLGMLNHGNAYKLQQEIRDIYSELEHIK